jgi:hypothetical protein
LVSLPEVNPGPHRGLSGCSLVIRCFSVRSKKLIYLCTSGSNLIYFLRPAPYLTSFNILLVRRVGVNQRSLVSVLKVLYLEGKEGKFQYGLRPFLFFPIPDVLLLEPLGIPTDVFASLYTIALFHMFHRHIFVMPVA